MKKHDHIRILLVDASQFEAERIKLLLEEAPGDATFEVEQVTGQHVLIETLGRAPADVVLLDLSRRGQQCVATIDKLHGRFPSIPVVAIYADEQEAESVKALRHGALAVVHKASLDSERISAAVEAAVDWARQPGALDGDADAGHPEGYFRALVERSSDLIAVIDAEGVVRYVSPSIKQNVGFTAADVVGRRALDMAHEDDLDRVRAAFELCKDTPGVPVSIELRLRHRNGSWLTFEGIGQNLLDDPDVHGVVFNARDVTARLEAQEELRISAAMHDAISSLLKLSLEDLPLPQLLERALEQITVLPWLALKPQGSLMLVGAEPRTLELVAAIGLPKEIEARCRHVGFDGCVCGRVARTGRLIYVGGAEDLETGERHDGCPFGHYSLPVSGGGRPIGVLNLFVDEQQPLGSQNRSFLDAVATALAGVIRRRNAEAESVRLSAFPRENPFPVLECAADGTVLYSNPAARELLWRHSVELDQLLPESHAAIVERALSGGEHAQTSESQVDDRVLRWIYHPVEALERVHVYGMDITDQRAVEEQLFKDALYDGLTGLPNRSLVTDRIQVALSRARRRADYRFAVLSIDLDAFKSVTEGLGHAAGDTILQEIARRASAFVHKDDTVARVGGDEFLVLLEELEDPAAATRFATGLQQAIAAPIEVDGHRIEVTASIGIVQGKPEYDRPEQLLRDADSSLYRAKRGGRDRVEVFDEQAGAAAGSQSVAAADLARALDNGEIVVWFQPVLSLKNLRILGFEALARWQHPERGIVGPYEFIPLAEQTGQIRKLGEQVLQRALEQLQSWTEQRLPITWLAVNLSAEQFQHADLIPDLERIFRETGANPARLSLEITEGTAARDPERAVQVLRTLRDMGIRLALDDFGTGYSSMSYLKRFPIHTLKIDREFVRDLPESQEDAAIATTVITMCRALGLKVVAEGVENERQALFLRSIGCDEVQGFMYSRPVPAAQATELLRNGYHPA